MKLICYVNTSDEKDINKTLEQKFTLDNIVWKEGTSILEPHFTFHKAKVNGSWQWKNFNYVGLVWDGMQTRYYFVRDMVLQPGGIIEVTCEEDVRYTWRTYIKAQKYIIARQEFLRNRVMPDDRAVLPLTRQVESLAIGNVGTGNEGHGSIILTVSGGNLTSNNGGS